MTLRFVTSSRVFQLLKKSFDAWMEDRALRLSAALSYYSIFSMTPLLIISISIAGLVLGEDAVKGQLSDQLKVYIGAQAAEAIQAMIQSASKPGDGWMGSIIGFVTLLIGASGVFGQLQDALNTIWEVQQKEGGGFLHMINERLLNFGMVLIIGFLLLISLLLTTSLAAFGRYVEHVTGIPPILGAAFVFVTSFTVATLLFAFIFKVLPDAQIRWRHVWIGAIATALLFEIGKFGLSYYLGRESTASGFGAAGSLVLLMLWVYYASCILLFGAEFTQIYAQEGGWKVPPAPNAKPVTAEARAQQGLAPVEAVKSTKPLASP